MFSNSEIAVLEQRYIEILQRKIAALETPPGDSPTNEPILVRRKITVGM